MTPTWADSARLACYNRRMTKKPPKKGLSESEAEYRHEGLTEAEWDAWGERNKEALNASLDEAEAEIERGECFSLEEVRAYLDAQAKHLQTLERS
jgi:hypothetical protein